MKIMYTSMTRLVGALSLGALLLVAQSAAAYHEEVKLDRATISDVRATLFGDPMKPGLMNEKKPFKASFREVVLTDREAPQLKQIIGEAANLPPDSEVKIFGTIDGRRFEAQLYNNEKGGKEAKLEGLMFASRQEALGFLDMLRDRGMREVKLRGFAEGRRVEGKIEDGKADFEG